MLNKKNVFSSLIMLFFCIVSHGQNSSSLIELIDDKKYEAAKEAIRNKKNINKRDEDRATPFMYAVYRNQLDIAKLLKQNGANVNLKGILYDDEWDLAVGSSLTAAAINGDLDIIKFLVLNCGIPANDKEIGTDGKEAWNALFYLAYREDFKDIADFLIEKGAAINLKDSDGKTPLSYAFLQNNTEYITYLLRKKATSPFIDSIGMSPASFHIFSNQPEAAKKILKGRLNFINQDSEPLENPLVAAFIQEDETMIKWLLDNGADRSIPLTFIDVIFKEAESRKSYGTYRLLSTYLLNEKLANKDLIPSKLLKNIIKQTQRVEVFTMLLNNDFTIHQNGEEFYPPNKYYRLAELNKKLRILEENNIKIDSDTLTNDFFEESFENKKFSINAFNHITKGLKEDNPFYYKLLEYAIDHNNVQAFNLILDKRIDLNVKLNHDSNFLWLAFKSENFYLFKQLIEKGANTEFKFKDGKTLLHKIILNNRRQSYSNTKFIEVLLKKGANVNAQDSEGNTPLHLSSKSYFDKLLIHFGANINLKNKKNSSPSGSLNSYSDDIFDFAESRENHDDLLVDYLNSVFGGNSINGFTYTLKYILNKGINLKDPKTEKKINTAIISLAKSSDYFNHFNKLKLVLEEYDTTYKAPNFDEILINKLTKTSKELQAIAKVILKDNVSDFKETLKDYDLNNPEYNNDTYLVLLTIAAQANSKEIVQYILELGITPLNRKIVPYSTPIYDKIDAFQILVDKKNRNAINYILEHEGDTNSFDIIDNYLILCELKDEQLIKNYIDKHLARDPNPKINFLENNRKIYNLNLGAVNNNLLGVVAYLSEKGMPVSKSLENDVGRSGIAHALNCDLIFEEKIDFIKFYFEKANVEQIRTLIGTELDFIIKTNKTNLINLFAPYIIEDKALLKKYYLSCMKYDNVYAMEVMFKILPKEKTSLLKDMIGYAIKERSNNFIATYYNHGFDMSLKLYERGPNTAGTGNQGMIEYAIAKGAPDMVEFLIGCDVPLDDPANNDDSPLEYAVETNNLALLEILLRDKNLDPNIIYDYYSMPWTHLVLNKGFSTGFEKFWKKGANPNLEDREGNNLLHVMVNNDYDFTLNASDVLDKIININERNNYGETALFLACKSGNIKLAEALLSKNANSTISNHEKVTPLMIASFTNNSSLVQILLKEKIKKNDKDFKERSALEYAKMGNATKVIPLLEN